MDDEQTPVSGRSDASRSDDAAAVPVEFIDELGQPISVEDLDLDDGDEFSTGDEEFDRQASDTAPSPLAWWRTAWKPRRRLAVGLAAVVGLVLIVWSVVSLTDRTARPEEFVKSFEAPISPLSRVVVSDDGGYVAAGASTGYVLAWETATGRRLSLERQTEYPIVALAISDDGFLAAGDENRRFFGWQLGRPNHDALPPFREPITCLAFAPSSSGGFEVAVGLASGALSFIDQDGIHSGPKDHSGSVKFILYVPDRGELITAGADGRLVWRDAGTHETLGAVQAHEAEIGGLACSPDGSVLVSGDWNGNIRAWRTRDRGHAFSTSQPEAVAGIAMTAQHLVTGSWDGKLRIFTAAGGTLLKEIETGNAIHDLGVTPDGTTAVTVSPTAEVAFWSLDPI